MPRTRLARPLLAAVLLIALAALPALAARGSADFSRYVVLGDSFGAGFSNNSLVISHQLWSYPAVIARQVGIPVCGPDPACAGFQQPLVSEPGIPPELELRSLFPSVSIAPKAQTNGQPINLALQRPYDNLSVPGFRAGHLTTVTGAEPGSGAAQFILRGLGTAVQQALALQPTFMTIWIGGNDVLAAVGGGDPALMTPIPQFTAAYAAMLDALIAGAPSAGMVVGTIADPAALPFAQTVPPVLVDPATNQPVLIGGQPLFLFAELTAPRGGQPAELGQLTPGSLLTLNAIEFLSTGYGIPPALAPGFPQLPNAGRPLPHSVVLTPAELTEIRTRANEVNAAIRQLAGSRDIPVVEFEELFSEIIEGIDFGGIQLDASFLTGGIFSLDGVHLTDIGYTLFANEYIEAINEAYGTEIPLASIVPFFQNNAPREEMGFIPPRAAFSFAPGALRGVLGSMAKPAEPPPSPSRRRSAGRF